MLNKIIKPENIKEKISYLRLKNRKIVTTNGVFDILHIGHIRYLKKAKELGDTLIIAINSDKSTKKLKGPKRPINDQDIRAEALSALEFVDYVLIFNETDPVKILSVIKPDFHVKGGDYNMDDIIEKKVVESNKGKVILVPEIKGFSTTDLIDKIIRIYQKQ